MASDYRLEYTSPDGQHKIVLDPNVQNGFMLLPTPEGMLAPTISFNTRKAPSQPGSTLTDTIIGERTNAVSFALLANDEEEYWRMRRDVAAALTVRRSRVGTVPPLGLLRAYRPGQPLVQVPCLPTPPRESGRPDRLSLIVSTEFFAPDPYWQEDSIAVATLAAGGGFEYPLEHPWESPANNVEQVIDNEGTVETPIIARLHGEFTGGRLINETTGHMMEYLGAVADGDYVEINTAFGRKSVEYVTAAGVRTSDMGNMDLVNSVFWNLQRGRNTVRFEADLNPSGTADILYRRRYGGI